MTIPITTQNAPGAAAAAIPDKPQGGYTTRTREPAFGKDGFNFFDLLDIINPLQHIPVISTLYRRLTGDEISPAARLAGGGLFGGPIGLAYAMFNNISDDATGKDLGQHVMALFIPDRPVAEVGTMLAEAKSGAVMDAPAEADKETENQAPVVNAAATAAVAALAARAEAGQQARAAAVRAGVGLGTSIGMGAGPGRVPAHPVAASPHGAFTINERLFNFLTHPYPLESSAEQDEDADKARQKDKDKRAQAGHPRGADARSPGAHRAADAYRAAGTAQVAALDAVFKRPGQ